MRVVAISFPARGSQLLCPALPAHSSSQCRPVPLFRGIGQSYLAIYCHVAWHYRLFQFQFRIMIFRRPSKHIQRTWYNLPSELSNGQLRNGDAPLEYHVRRLETGDNLFHAPDVFTACYGGARELRDGISHAHDVEAGNIQGGNKGQLIGVRGLNV